MKKNYIWLLMLFVFGFSNAQVGTTCEDPIVIESLPFSTTDNTANYADNYDPQTVTHPVCAGGTNGNYYHGGNDVIYSFTPTTDTSVNFRLPGVVAWTGMFVYTDCANIGISYAACSTSSAAGNREINDFAVTAGQTYYILISTWPTPQTFAYTLNVTENSCTNATATYTVVSDCANGPQFMVDVDITSLGTATSLTISDNQGSATQSVSATGIVTFGPYPNTTSVVFTVQNDQDANCVLTSPARTQAVCPPANDTCATAIDLTNETSPLSATTVGATNTNTTVCNNSGVEVANTQGDVYYSILVPNGSTLTIGQTVNGYDSANVVFYGDCDNRTSIACFDDDDVTQVQWANDTGSEQTVYWVQDGWSGVGTFTLAWSVIACTPSEATYTVVSDCANGEQFLVDVEVTEMGSATSITVMDDQGSTPQTVSSAGIVTFGPYPNAAPVIFTVTNDQDDNCTLTSPALNQLACPPANDNCSEAEELVVNTDYLCGSVTSSSLAGATGSTVAGNTCFGNPNDDIWFSFEATASSHRVSLLNVTPSVDLYHSLWTGDCEGLTLVAGSCSDGNTSNPAGLVPGQVYYVRVYSYGAASTSSTFDICIGTPPPPPANDTCEGAIDLTNQTSPLSSTTEGATNTNTTVCNNSGNQVANTYADVYYSIVIPSGSTLTIGQTVNSYDSANVVFYGDCDNRTSIACFDDDDYTQVVWANDTGSEQTVYWVQDGWSGTGTFTLAWSVVACTPAEATYTVVSDCANGDQFLVDVDVTNMGSATSITVSDNQGSAPQTVSATGIVTFGPYPNAQSVIFTVVNDQDDNCTLTSPARTQTACPPLNDNFEDAIAVECGMTYSGNTNLATLDEDNAPDGGGADLDGKNVWYSYTGSGTPETVTLNFCQSSYDTSVLVYTGTSGNLTFVAANDDGYACGDESLDTRSYLNFESDGTTTYYITVEGWNIGSSGAYVMEMSCAAVIPPAVENQSCDLALEIPVDGTTTESDNSFGTVNPTQPSCDTFGSIQDVWFSFTAPTSGSVECAIVNGTMTSGNFNIYSGTCDALVPVSGTCNTNLATGGTEDLTGLVGGNTYFVQVWSSSTEQGTFSVTVTDEQLGINHTASLGFKAYPNPVKDVLNLSYTQAISNVEVFNILGQQVIAKSVNATQGQVDMSNLAMGTYLVRITADNQVKTIKVIKQ